MSAKKNSTKAATAVAKANAEDGVPARVAKPTAQVATFEKVEATPKQKNGKSKIEFPVAFVWMLCMNAIGAANAAGQPIPSRKSLQAQAEAAGVAFYTARTQVQEYLKQSKNGTVIPAKLPRGIKLEQKEAAPAAAAE